MLHWVQHPSVMISKHSLWSANFRAAFLPRSPFPGSRPSVRPSAACPGSTGGLPWALYGQLLSRIGTERSSPSLPPWHSFPYCVSCYEESNHINVTNEMSSYSGLCLYLLLCVGSASLLPTLFMSIAALLYIPHYMHCPLLSLLQHYLWAWYTFCALL